MSAHTNPGTYPGNPSLPGEVKEKILSTFRHTLNLFGEGKLDDCIIGCDFILKMDARFAPARQLLEKARNPASAIDVAQLEALVATTPTRQERVVAADPERLLVRAVESFNARDFGAAIAAAEQVLQVLPGNQDAVEILDKATRKKTAQPLFDGSRQRALAALEADRPEDARRELEQMRSLDPDHPAVALLERRIPSAAGAPPPPPKPAEPKRPVPPPPPDFGGLDFDTSEPTGEPAFGSEAAGGFGGATNEPDIRFDDGATVAIRVPPALSVPPPPPQDDAGGLDALSLDSLSLDLPPSVSPLTPPAGGRSGLGGPLQNVAPTPPPQPPPSRAPAPNPPPPPPPPPISNAPPDLWSEESGGLDLEEPLEEAESPPYSPGSPPPPAFHASSNTDLEEEEARTGEREIAALLKQGDDAAHRGDRQQAIEVWSRIFLIDINNSEAVTRIEKARQDMAEGNRVISEGLKTGREIYEKGDLAGAREHFLQVLTADENEPTARFYLDRIQEEMANPGGASTDAEAELASVMATGGGSGVKVSPSAAAAKEHPRTGRIAIPPRVLVVVGAFALFVLAGVYFFVLRAPRPKSAAASSAGTSAPASLARARELLGTGKIAEARTELRRVPPNSPEFAEAQKTLTELGKPSGETATGPQSGAPMSVASETGPPPVAADAEPARLRALAERNLAEKRYIDAMKNFSQAAPAFKNDPTFGQSMGVAAEKVTALTPAVKLYNEGEYETAIPILWRIYQEDRENQDAKSYLLRAYYNQGITQLQNGMYPKAIESFNEALTLEPTDSETIRHRKFAERYQKNDLDLMGRIYVRHLNHRP